MNTHPALILVRTLAILLGLFWTSNFASAATSLPDRINAVVQPLSEEVSEIGTAIDNANSDENALSDLRKRLETLRTESLDRLLPFQLEIVNLIQQQERLPAAPAEGDPDEPAEIKAERKRIADLIAKTRLAMKDGELVAVRANAMLTQVLEKTRAAYISNLLRQRRVDDATFGVIADNRTQVFGSIWSTFSGWIAATIKNQPGRLVLALIISVLLWTGFAFVVGPFRRWMRYAEGADEVSQLTRVAASFFGVVLPAAAFLVMAFGLHHLFSYLGLYRLRIDQMVPALLALAFSFVIAWLLLKTILAPNIADQRWLNTSDSAARKLFWLCLLVVGVFAIDEFFSRMFVLFSAPVEFTIVKSLFAALLIAAFLVMILFVRLRPTPPGKEPLGFRGWNPVVYVLLWGIAFALVLSTLAGYISLASFLARQLVVTGSILAVAYLGYRAAAALAETKALSPTGFGRALMARYGISEMRLDQLGLVLSILLNIAIVLIAIPLLALQWGYQSADIAGWARQSLTGFSVGGFQLSIGRVLLAVFVFIVVVAITKAIQRWLDSKVFVRTRLDSGLKNSMRSGIGYIGYFAAALIGLSWAGLNLSNIALIAGALSVGIGFGLQNIVNNFVSGIILLIERPIKVGDIIAVAGAEGVVRKINVRATELETFDRQSVIIPNSEMINSAVGNWMHHNNRRRVNIAIGVGYDSDPELVRELLLDVARDNPMICEQPEPFVYFADFGASSLDFQLRVIIHHVDDTLTVENDLRYAIVKTLGEHGIEIPFPQRDLNFKSGLEPLINLKDSAAPKGKKGKA